MHLRGKPLRHSITSAIEQLESNRETCTLISPGDVTGKPVISSQFIKAWRRNRVQVDFSDSRDPLLDISPGHTCRHCSIVCMRWLPCILPMLLFASSELVPSRVHVIYHGSDGLVQNEKYFTRFCGTPCVGVPGSIDKPSSLSLPLHISSSSIFITQR